MLFTYTVSAPSVCLDHVSQVSADSGQDKTYIQGREIKVDSMLGVRAVDIDVLQQDVFRVNYSHSPVKYISTSSQSL